MNYQMKVIAAFVATAGVMCGGWLGVRKIQAVAYADEAPATVETSADVDAAVPASEPASVERRPEPPPAPGTPQTAPNLWTLTFSDEFDGNRLNGAKWLDCYPGGVRTHSNNEQQFYAPDGVTVGGGRMTFTALRREMGGKPYTSGMVSSHGRFMQKYGWFEIRARFPKGQGMWPAFWLLPNTRTWPPEIDVLEILGHETDRVYFSNHWANRKGVHEHQTQEFDGPDFSKNFHVFAAHWKPDEILWYVDGRERARTGRQVPQVPMYVIANLAVGGDWPGMPDDTTPFPGTMEVDYIRVYRKKP
ncbi:MAG: glycoside hydrolase family 16 protein [Capsulimonadales bacterium]|nr:glycoside hydrolase family 16 protein [Capsulimonadales bacterium]